MSKDLYIKNIALEISEEELRKLFAVCGKVTYVHMVKDATSGEFVGCAYVKMSSEAEAKDAIVTLDGARMGNREIVVKEALPQKTANKGPVGKYPGKPLSRRPAAGAPGRAAKEAPDARGPKGPRGPAEAQGYKGPKRPQGSSGRKAGGPGASFSKSRGPGKSGGRGK